MITNKYFEPLYNTNLGSIIHCDTLLVNHYTKIYYIETGTYKFSTDTESGLEINAYIDIKGDTRNINLTINEQGQLHNE